MTDNLVESQALENPAKNDERLAFSFRTVKKSDGPPNTPVASGMACLLALTSNEALQVSCKQGQSTPTVV
jgi:hypothetical protein